MGDGLTFFTVPRGFEGAVAVRQTNAIRSWLEMGPVILFGNDPGVGGFAARFGCQHVPDVKCGELGTPYVSDAFRRFQATISGPAVYLNADVILPDDGMVQAMDIVAASLGKFLIVGLRTDFAFDEEINFSSPTWRNDVRESVKRSGSPHGVWGVDYMGFTSPLWRGTPLFYVGRIRWDTWYVAEAARLGAQLVEVTDVVLAAHPHHGYEHLPGAAMRDDNPEVAWNVAMAGGQALGAQHTHWILDEAGLRRK